MKGNNEGLLGVNNRHKKGKEVNKGSQGENKMHEGGNHM